MAVTCEQSVHELAELLCIPGDPYNLDGTPDFRENKEKKPPHRAHTGCGGCCKICYKNGKLSGLTV